MLLTVSQFREEVTDRLDALVGKLQVLTCRYGSEEAQAWKDSLPKLAAVLSAPTMQPLHLYCAGKGDLALEYPLPASMSWADVVLLGAHNGIPSAIVVELKHWITRADRPGKAEGLIERQGSQELHPSDQVRGYVNYCQRFHSAVHDAGAVVHGCVLFTRDYVVRPYVDAPNQELAANFPLFTMSREDLGERVPEYFRTRLTESDSQFAQAFEAGKYRQDRGFVQQIAAQIMSSDERPFELLDNQRRAFALCKAIIEEVIVKWTAGNSGRRVIVVRGPPGSGKSAVAARLWAAVSMMDDVPDGDIIFVTTSLSQNTNWGRLFAAAGPEGARGVIKKATSFHPVTTHRVGRLRSLHGVDFIKAVADWRANLKALKAIGEAARDGARDLQTLISIVDEAHSLINTEREGGVGQFGFAPTLGPQAYHIIRTSTLSVFFIDPAQGFRQRENTTIEDLQAWAQELGAGELIEISLEGVQFRCAGSGEYVAWLEALLEGASLERNRVLAAAWYLPTLAVAHEPVASTATGGSSAQVRRAAQPTQTYAAEGNLVVLRRLGNKQPFDFRIFEDPLSMEEALREQMGVGASARLLSTYSRRWVTRAANAPHHLPPSQQDFYEPVDHNGKRAVWSRVWNVVPGATDDYSYFVQGAPGSAIADDPLCEVGCPYAVRGFDYDYIGVLWLEDMVWRSGRWYIDLAHAHESGLSALVRRARNEKHTNEATVAMLQEKIAQAYRIILTRALKGAFLWIKDPETRAYVTSSLRGQR
jgi:hypothetical protein